MTPVLMAAALLAGVLIGLRVNARRVATYRERLRLLTERHDAWNLQAKATDLAEVGPVTGDTRTVELYDQDAEGPLGFVADGVNAIAHDELPADVAAELHRGLLNAVSDCPEDGGCRRPEQCETGCHWLRLAALNREVGD